MENGCNEILVCNLNKIFEIYIFYIFMRKIGLTLDNVAHKKIYCIVGYTEGEFRLQKYAMYSDK